MLATRSTVVEPTAASLELLLSIEDDPGLLEVRCSATGMPLWAALRQRVLRQFISDWLYRGGLHGGRGSSVRQRMSALSRAALGNALRRPEPSSLLFVCTGAGLLITPEGKTFNRHTDYFAQACDAPVWTVEGSAAGVSRGPRAQPRCSSSVPAALGYALAARALPDRRARGRSEVLVDRVVANARAKLGHVVGDDVRADWITAGARLLAELPRWAGYWGRLLRRVRPRLAIVEEGCYGVMAVFNVTARALGVRVGEFQHGAVSSGHDAYNFAPAMRESAAFRETLPDSFLAYGAWWADQINAPLRKVVIGNPHRDQRLAGRPSASAVRERAVLVLGDGIETALYVGFCNELASHLPQSWQVTYRPHPLERERLASGRAPPLRAGVLLDLKPDIYDRLAGAEAVVSELSTGLFEAIGLVRRVFVWSTDKARFAFPSHPFASAATPRALADLLLDPSAGEIGPSAVIGAWADDWRTRFRRYLSEEGV